MDVNKKGRLYIGRKSEGGAQPCGERQCFCHYPPASIAPLVADGIEVVFLDPAAPVAVCRCI